MDENKAPQHDDDLKSSGQSDATLDAELTPKQWVMQNGPILAIVFALMLFAYYRGGINELINWAKVIVGLGLVIFVHELGHFLVAKWCDVHVTVFSIGFGPAIPGCSFKWGETLYKLAIIPLGGFVQMVGQVDGTEESDGSEDDPRSYRNKSVLQRMAIISAGVIMNVIMAVICFFLVFYIPGKMRIPAVVSQIDSSSPSFVEGIPTGAVIEEIGGIEKPYFELVAYSALRWYGSEMPLTYKIPQEKTAKTIYIVPRTPKFAGRPVIGIAFPRQLAFVENRDGEDFTKPVMPESAAAKAEPSFAFEDEIVGMSDPADPTKVTELPLDSRFPNLKKRDFLEYLRRLQQLAGKEIIFRVQRGKKDDKKLVDIKVPPAFHSTLGMTMTMGEISAIRKNSPAAKAELQSAGIEGDKVGDVIVAVEVPEADGSITRFSSKQREKAPAAAGMILMPPLAQILALEGKSAITREEILDPVRLPDRLKEWADRLARAKVPAEKWRVTLNLRRDGKEEISRILTWNPDWRFDRIEAFSLYSPQAIGELGLAYQIRPLISQIDEKMFQGEGDKPQVGDKVKSISLHFVVDEKGTVEAGKSNPLPANSGWAYIHSLLQTPGVKKATLELEREIGSDKTKTFSLDLTPAMVKDWPMDELGLALMPDFYLEKADGFVDAVAMGFRDTHYKVMEVLMVIRGLSTGSIHFTKSIGGPLKILEVGRRFAGFDIWEFLFFLGMISVNLAVINFLPIPILDGGHMVFLTYELIRGKEASERVRQTAVIAGFVFLVALFLAVTVLDISSIMKITWLQRFFGQ